MEKIAYRTCTQCHAIKEEELFVKRGDSYRNICKSCENYNRRENYQNKKNAEQSKIPFNGEIKITAVTLNPEYGVEKVDNGVEKVDNGVEKVDNGVEKVDNGVEKVDNGVEKTDRGVEKTDHGVEKSVTRVRANGHALPTEDKVLRHARIYQNRLFPKTKAAAEAYEARGRKPKIEWYEFVLYCRDFYREAVERGDVI